MSQLKVILSCVLLCLSGASPPEADAQRSTSPSLEADRRASADAEVFSKTPAKDNNVDSIDEADSRATPPLTVEQAKALMETRSRRLDAALDAISEMEFESAFRDLTDVPPAEACEHILTDVIPTLRDWSSELLDDHQAFRINLDAYRHSMQRAITPYEDAAVELELQAANESDELLSEGLSKLAADVRSWKRSFQSDLQSFEEVERAAAEDVRFIEASQRYLSALERVIRMLPSNNVEAIEINAFLKRVDEFKKRMERVVELFGDEKKKLTRSEPGLASNLYESVPPLNRSSTRFFTGIQFGEKAEPSVSKPDGRPSPEPSARRLDRLLAETSRLISEREVIFTDWQTCPSSDPDERRRLSGQLTASANSIDGRIRLLADSYPDDDGVLELATSWTDRLSFEASVRDAKVTQQQLEESRSRADDTLIALRESQQREASLCWHIVAAIDRVETLTQERDEARAELVATGRRSTTPFAAGQ